MADGRKEGGKRSEIPKGLAPGEKKSHRLAATATSEEGRRFDGDGGFFWVRLSLKIATKWREEAVGMLSGRAAGVVEGQKCGFRVVAAPTRQKRSWATGNAQSLGNGQRFGGGFGPQRCRRRASGDDGWEDGMG